MASLLLFFLSLIVDCFQRVYHHLSSLSRCFVFSKYPDSLGTLSMHRLVQAVLFDSMEEQERELWDLRVTKTLDAVFPESGPAAWEQCERLLLHVLTCLDRTGATTARLEAASLAT